MFLSFFFFFFFFFFFYYFFFHCGFCIHNPHTYKGERDMMVFVRGSLFEKDKFSLIVPITL